jgi:hypothetical protein
MRLTYSTQSTAQAVCDRIHASMIATDADYAQSAEANQTLRWAVPSQDVDDAGNPVGTNWYVGVNDRCRGVLTDDEALSAGFLPPETV